MRPQSIPVVLLVLAAACSGLPREHAVTADLAAAFIDMDSVRTDVLEPGVLHVSAYDARGPWTIHVVAVDASVCRPVLEVRKPAGTLSARATTSVLSGDALASVNADFFRLPGGTPVGAHVTGGVPLIGPTDWPAFGVTAAGAWRAGSARMDGHVRVRADSARVVQINRPAEPFSSYVAGTPEGITLFTSRADTLPPDSAALLIRLQHVEGSERAGRGVVVALDTVAGSTVVEDGAAVLLARGNARTWARRRAAGDTVHWETAIVVGTGPAGNAPAMEVVGGFPHLLDNGVDVLGTQTVRDAFGLARHPRTALGWNRAARRLYLVVVDGRQPPYSDGMSLPELTWLFQRLGATDALNLDGGGSTAMVIRGSLVNRPSDTEGERPVGNALTLERCQAR